MFEIDELYLKAIPQPSVAAKPVQELYGKEAIAYLADVVESEQWPFDMRYTYIASCDTPGCIAGHAAAIWPDCRCLNLPAFSQSGVEHRLGISADVSGAMFIMVGASSNYRFSDTGNHFGMSAITPKIAAAMLRNYIATGHVEWRERVAQNRDLSAAEVASIRREFGLDRYLPEASAR